MKIYIHAFTDLNEHQTNQSSSNIHRNPATPAESEMYVFSSVEHTTLTESENCETENFNNKAPETKLEDISSLMSLTSEEADPRNEELHQDSLSTEDKNKKEDEVDEDDSEEFEETLIEPRTLNEVTSATDRTSPWTTVLSDPDLDSLESLEATEQFVDLLHKKRIETVMSPPVTTSKPQGTATDSDFSSETGSCENAVGDAKDMYNVCMEYRDEEMFFKQDFTPDTRQMTDHDQHDSRIDAEDDSPLSSRSGSSARANSESENDESKVKVYPFCLQYCQ